MATAQETSAEDILRMTQEPLPDATATPPTATLPEFSADEVLSLATQEPDTEEADPRDVALQGAMAMYDWRNPRPSRDEYFANKDLLADLKKQGVAADGPGVGAMIGDLFVSAADAISSAVWKYDPANEGSITLRNAADFVTRGMYSNLQGLPSTYNPGAAMIETGRRAGATLAGANEFNLDFYKSLSRGLASSPKYRVEETGEFVYPGTMMPDAGMGDTTFDLVQMYKQQGKTLRTVNEEDLKDLEYEQFLQKLDSTQQLETLMEQGTASAAGTMARSVGVPEQVVSAGGDFVGRLNETIDIAARASGLAPAGYRTADLPWNEPQKPIQSQSMIGSMLVDPGAIAAGSLAPVRFGITAAAKGATARTLELTGKAATTVANLGDKGAKGARVAQRAKRLLGAGGIGAVANVLGQNMDSEAADEAVRFLNYGLGAYATLVGGGAVLRGYGKYAGKASYLLRESIGPGNAIDKGARAAVAVNPDVPLRYKDPLVRPSVYAAMESTPARLSKDMSLSPRARKLFGTLADWRAVQAVRGTSAAASGAVKGALANVPFSEPLRAAGEEDAANLMLGLGAVIGAPMGVASRVSGTAGRRAMAADSDVGRMLAEVQGMGETVPRKRAPRANPDGEVARTLTEVELAGGDVSAMVNNLSPDQLNEFAAVQGYYRDVIDLVPLNRADYDANRGALNPSVTDPIFLHAPDGERPRVFVNVEDAGSIKAGDLGRAFLKSESLPDRQVTAMINSVDTLYTPEQIAARERAIAKAEIDAKYAKQGVKGGATDAEIELRLAMLRSKSQTEFGDANIWSRQAIAAEDLSNGIVDWNRMRRGLPKGNNPITHLENVLGAQARGLMISGVRIDPETGRPLDTPESIKRTNPAAADDPAVAQGLKNYTEGYNKMRRDPANETPTTEPVSPERAAAIELSMTDAPLRARQIMDLAGGPDGPSLTPDNLSFGWRQEGNRRILAGRSLPDRIRYANHWKPHLEMIDTVQAAIDDGTPVAVRFDALGPSADVTKRPGPQYGATTREGVLVRWQATTGRKRENYKGGGELNVLLADMTTLRNRAITVMEAKHPTLDPSRGGPGYSLAAIMADAETYIANKGRNADPGAGLTPERLRVAKGLIEYGPDNVFGGLIDKDGIWRTPRLELIESVTPTGRRGHNMVSNTESGAFVQPPPKPMPDMGSDVAPATPDAPAAAARDRIKRNLSSQSGALDVSILADLVDYGRSLYRAGMDAAVWTANMIKEFGQRIKPLLQEAFKRVVSAYQASRFSDTTGAVNVTGMNKPKAAVAPTSQQTLIQRDPSGQYEPLGMLRKGANGKWQVYTSPMIAVDKDGKQTVLPPSKIAEYDSEAKARVRAEKEFFSGLSLQEAKQYLGDRERRAITDAQKRIAEVAKNNPEAARLEVTRDERGLPKVGLIEDGDGNPVLDDRGNQMFGAIYKGEKYGLRDAPGLSKDEARAVQQAADLMEADARRGRQNPAIAKGIGWYGRMRGWLQRAYGATIELFGQLLGATSARTPVDMNFIQAREALQLFGRGAYDDLLKRFDDFVMQKKADADSGKMEADWRARGGKGKFDLNDEYRKQVNSFKEVPLRANGKKYNANSTKVLHALYGNWIAQTKGPKTPNFAGNLTGRTFKATIDVWAARNLRRLLYQGKKKRWRILPEQEQGVTDADFFFAQKVYDEVGRRMGVATDDLQALQWFNEKDIWEANGWTDKTGAEKSSFDKEAGKLNVDRYQVGLTTFTTPEQFDPAVQRSEMATFRDSVRQLEGLEAARVTESEGLYGDVVEPSFDVEFSVNRRGDVSPSIEPVMRSAIDTARRNNQKDVIISLVVDELHPNARPMVEVGFKRAATKAEVDAVTAAFRANGIDGFTIARNERGDALGVRSQYVPEISARYDTLDHLNPDQFAINSGQWVDKARKAIANLKNQDNVSYRKEGYVSTAVYGIEEYATATPADLRGSNAKQELGRRRAILAAGTR